MQQLNLNSQINIDMKKVTTTHLTASNNYQQSINSVLSKDEDYNFMNPVKGTPELTGNDFYLKF